MILSYLLSNMNIKNLNLGRVYTKKLGEQFNALLHIFTAESIWQGLESKLNKQVENITRNLLSIIYKKQIIRSYTSRSQINRRLRWFNRYRFVYLINEAVL
jgi:hypothetical protein